MNFCQTEVEKISFVQAETEEKKNVFCRSKVEKASLLSDTSRKGLFPINVTSNSFISSFRSRKSRFSSNQSRSILFWSDKSKKILPVSDKSKKVLSVSDKSKKILRKKIKKN